MRTIKSILLLLILSFPATIFPQKGEIKGQVVNQRNNDPIEFAGIQIQGTTIGTTSDEKGSFILSDVNPGFVRLIVSFLGFETTISSEIQVQGNQTTFVDIYLPESSVQLQEVSIRPNYNVKRIESPISVISVGVQEIEKGAGVNRDISKVI